MWEDNDLNLDFDTADVEQTTPDYSPIPEGIYEARIDRVEIKPTKDGTGRRLLCFWKICGPSHVGRVIISSFNVNNKNPRAQSIARSELNRMLQAIDMVGERDMSRVVGAECNISVVIRPAQNGYAESNDVKRFIASSSAAPAPSAQPTTTTAKKAPAFMR